MIDVFIQVVAKYVMRDAPLWPVRTALVSLSIKVEKIPL